MEDRFGIQQQLLAQAKTYIATGQIKVVNGHLMLSKEGKFFADGIAADLFAD